MEPALTIEERVVIQGFIAGKLGLKRKDNPHQGDSKLCALWESGHEHFIRAAGPPLAVKKYLLLQGISKEIMENTCNKFDTFGIIDPVLSRALDNMML